MQKSEVVTIRTNSDIKKLVEDAKNNSGQTASEWLEQAVIAWQEKHCSTQDNLQLDSVHIIAGRKALQEVSKIMEALEQAGKQTLALCQQDNLSWQKKLSDVESELIAKNNQQIEFETKLKELDSQHKQALDKLNNTIKKQQEDIENLELSNKALKEVAQCLEQERIISERLYTAKEKLESNVLELESKYKSSQLENQSIKQSLAAVRLNLQNEIDHKENLAAELKQLEKANMELRVSSEYLQKNLSDQKDTLDNQKSEIQRLQKENIDLLKNNGELSVIIAGLENNNNKK